MANTMQDDMARFVRGSAFRRSQSPEGMGETAMPAAEVAELLAVLCSDDCRLITGASIPVDRALSTGLMASTLRYLHSAELIVQPTSRGDHVMAAAKQEPKPRTRAMAALRRLGRAWTIVIDQLLAEEDTTYAQYAVLYALSTGEALLGSRVGALVRRLRSDDVGNRHESRARGLHRTGARPGRWAGDPCPSHACRPQADRALLSPHRRSRAHLRRRGLRSRAAPGGRRASPMGRTVRAAARTRLVVGARTAQR